MTIRKPRASTISFKEVDELQEFESESAIENDNSLKRGSKLRQPKVAKKNSFTRLGQMFTRAIKSKVRPSRIEVTQRHTTNSPNDEPIRLNPLSPIPQISASPTPKRSIKDSITRPIHHKRNSNPDLEIPEENIKTLLTLGFMSSLAINLETSDADSLTSLEINEIIEMEEKKERLRNLRTEANPISIEYGTKIPILRRRHTAPVSQGRPRTFKDETPTRREITVPVTNRITKWSIDGRLIKGHETQRRWQPLETDANIVRKKPTNNADNVVDKYDEGSNYNEKDKLGPWKVKSFTTKSQEAFRQPPPTPSMSEKYLFGKNGMMVNPKQWFEMSKKPKVKSSEQLADLKDGKPRWRI